MQTCPALRSLSMDTTPCYPIFVLDTHVTPSADHPFTHEIHADTPFPPASRTSPPSPSWSASSRL